MDDSVLLITNVVYTKLIASPANRKAEPAITSANHSPPNTPDKTNQSEARINPNQTFYRKNLVYMKKSIG